MTKITLTEEEVNYLNNLVKNEIVASKIAYSIYDKLNPTATVKKSYNGIYLTADDTFTTERSEAVIPFNYDALSKLIKQGKLYFDFSEDAEEEKADCLLNGEEWHDDYSYEKVTDIFRAGRNLWSIEADNVDPMYMTLRDIKLIDAVTIDVKDEWAANEEPYRRLTIRI